MIDRTRQHEQQIRQAVDVGQQVRLDVIRTKRDDRSLRAAANRSRKVQKRAGAAPARQDESAKRRQLGFEPIDPVFETLHITLGDRHFCDAPGNFLRRVRQARADSEQILLQLFEQPGDIAGQVALRAHGPEARIQLVDVSVRGYSRISFGHARAPKQRSAACIARARVNLHGGQYT